MIHVIQFNTIGVKNNLYERCLPFSTRVADALSPLRCLSPCLVSASGSVRAISSRRVALSAS